MAAGSSSEKSDRTAAEPVTELARRRPTATAAAFWTWLKRAIDLFSEINGTVWSASFSYYAFFALVPMVLLLVTVSTDVAARFVGEQNARDAAFRYVVTNIPLGPQGQELLGSTLRGVLAARGSIGVVALVSLLWSSLGFFQSLVSAVNQAFGQEPLNWWRLPMKNLTLLGVLTSALLLGNVVPLILKTVQAYVTFGETWVPMVFSLASYLAPAVVLFYGFLLFYKVAPRRRAGVTFSMVWVPALIVTALLQIAQQLFVFYSAHLANFNAVYGAFGGVIALLLWTYLSGMIVVFGGCLCAGQQRLRATPGVETGGLAKPQST